MTNPLLQAARLPAFSRILPEHVAPALDRLLADNRARLDALAQATRWETLIEPFEAMEERLNRAWSPVRHLSNVMDAPALRQAYQAAVSRLSEYGTEVSQHAGLFAALERLAADPSFASLTPAQHKLVNDALRDFRLAGVHLPDTEKARFKELSRRLAEVETRFESNVLDATDAWTLAVADPARLAGLPQDIRAHLRKRAQAAGLDGWLLTLEYPVYHAVTRHLNDRELRRACYTAYTTRASEQGPHGGRWDNTPLLQEILSARAELARMTGFANFAERSLATKMAHDPGEIEAFLLDLVARVRPRAQREYAELRAFAASEYGMEDVQPWDRGWLAERLRERTHDISKEALRPYFPLTRVLEGLCAIFQRLYGIRLQATSGVDIWREEVVCYAIHDEQGELRGHLYTDLFARQNKREGAWMDEGANRMRHDGEIDAPVAYLTCNFAPASDGRPALLDHEEVLTLFHEFGHCLHHLLTRVDMPSIAGINGVPWDAVELPSQFHEHFAWNAQGLALVSGHYETGEPLPDSMRDSLLAARNFHAAGNLLRQLEFALFDLRLHWRPEPGDDPVAATLAAVRAEVAVAPVPEWNRFAHAFTHIFGGGYAAGYYSYLWADVLASDAFARLEETGDPLDPEQGRRFMQCILEQGGSREAMALFEEFRGREPELSAFLRHNGIAQEIES